MSGHTWQSGIFGKIRFFVLSQKIKTGYRHSRVNLIKSGDTQNADKQIINHLIFLPSAQGCSNF
jgi:hypothetical protein